MKLLIVDDNRDNIVSLRLLLEQLPHDYDIDTATSGSEALSLIEIEITA